MSEERYDAWLEWFLTSRCNLGCAYCSNNQPNILDSTYGCTRSTHLNDEMDIDALMRTLDRTKRTFAIGITGGGEPFLSKHIIELCREITKKHYIKLNTNLTSPKIKKFAEIINPDRVLYILASLHIKELEKRNLLETYIDTFLFCRDKGFNIIAQQVAYPPLLDEIEKYKNLFENRGITISFTPFGGLYNDKTYPDAYTTDEIKLFGFSDDVRNKYHQKGGICNAGYNTGIVDIAGDVHPCFNRTNETIGNIYKEINFKNDLSVCPCELCCWPTNKYQPELFEKALKEKTQPRKRHRPWPLSCLPALW